MLRAAMGYLAAADATAMAAEEQAECLLALEEMGAVWTAARAKVLGAFTAAQGYAADGDYSSRSWLIHRTRITRGAAAGHLAWARRAAAHPRMPPSRKHSRSAIRHYPRRRAQCWVCPACQARPSCHHSFSQ